MRRIAGWAGTAQLAMSVVPIRRFEEAIVAGTKALRRNPYSAFRLPFISWREVPTPIAEPSYLICQAMVGALLGP
jgi:hypothetical protein